MIGGTYSQSQDQSQRQSTIERVLQDWTVLRHYLEFTYTITWKVSSASKRRLSGSPFGVSLSFVYKFWSQVEEPGSCVRGRALT